MVIGGYISAAGLGLTCPDWPLCPNGILPDDEYFIEWLHRLIAATTGGLVIATAVGCWTTVGSHWKIRTTGTLAAIFVVTQITPGCVGNRHAATCRVGIHTFWHWNIAFCHGSINYVVCIQTETKTSSDYTLDFDLRFDKYTYMNIIAVIIPPIVTALMKIYPNGFWALILKV